MLSDNEIIKAYEFCSKDKGCTGCIADKNPKSGEIDCKLKPQDIIDLLNRLQAKVLKEQNKNSKLRNERNRLQAENETLKSEFRKELEEHEAFTLKAKAKIENERLKSEYSILEREVAEDFGNLLEQIKTAKAEAYKEFAERFKQIAGIYQKDTYVIGVDEFDNLLKEMVGEDK